MMRIRFNSRDDEKKGYYLLATEASVRSLRGGFYEVTQPRLALLDQHNIKYKIIALEETAVEETQADRNPLTVEL